VACRRAQLRSGTGVATNVVTGHRESRGLTSENCAAPQCTARVDHQRTRTPGSGSLGPCGRRNTPRYEGADDSPFL